MPPGEITAYSKNSSSLLSIWVYEYIFFILIIYYKNIYIYKHAHICTWGRACTCARAHTHAQICEGKSQTTSHNSTEGRGQTHFFSSSSDNPKVQIGHFWAFLKDIFLRIQVLISLHFTVVAFFHFSLASTYTRWSTRQKLDYTQIVHWFISLSQDFNEGKGNSINSSWGICLSWIPQQCWVSVWIQVGVLSVLQGGDEECVHIDTPRRHIYQIGWHARGPVWSTLLISVASVPFLRSQAFSHQYSIVFYFVSLFFLLGYSRGRSCSVSMYLIPFCNPTVCFGISAAPLRHLEMGEKANSFRFLWLPYL